MTSDTFLQLQQLYTSYHARGLEIIVFPSNQFSQAPGSGDELPNSVKYIRPGNGYVFPGVWGAKIDVNGQNAPPFMQFLQYSCGPWLWDSMFTEPQSIQWTPINAYQTVWNFEKWLIDRRGIPVTRYAPHVMPSTLTADIEKLLG
jgi:glutathione peroxidase